MDANYVANSLTRIIVPGVGDNFGWDVLGGAAKGPGFVPEGDLFGEAHVYQTHVAVGVYHKVFRLQIAVAVAPLVQVVERLYHTRTVETPHCVAKRP